MLCLLMHQIFLKFHKKSGKTKNSQGYPQKFHEKLQILILKQIETQLTLQKIPRRQRYLFNNGIFIVIKTPQLLIEDYMKIKKTHFTVKHIVLFFLTLLAFASFAVAEDVTLSKLERKMTFEFRVDIKIFRFEGQDLTPSQQEINRKIEHLVTYNLQEFCYDFSEFLKESANYMPSLEMTSTLSHNSSDYFSMRIDIMPWHQGACGFPGTVETFNFKIVDGKLKALAFSDIASTESERKLLVRKAVKKICERDKFAREYAEKFQIKDYLDDFDCDSLKFTFSNDFIEIIFPAGTMFPLTLGIHSAKIKFNSIEKLSKRFQLHPAGVSSHDDISTNTTF